MTSSLTLFCLSLPSRTGKQKHCSKFEQDTQHYKKKKKKTLIRGPIKPTQPQNTKSSHAKPPLNSIKSVPFLVRTGYSFFYQHLSGEGGKVTAAEIDVFVSWWSWPCLQILTLSLSLPKTGMLWKATIHLWNVTLAIPHNSKEKCHACEVTVYWWERESRGCTKSWALRTHTHQELRICVPFGLSCSSLLSNWDVILRTKSEWPWHFYSAPMTLCFKTVWLISLASFQPWV